MDWKSTQDFKLELYAYDYNKIDDLKKLWNNFNNIYNQIKNNELSSDNVKTVTKDWLRLFVSLFEPKHITPYIHGFVYHLHEMVEKHGDINQYAQEGMEKLNHLTHSQVFRATNLDKTYLQQVLRKRNRMEALCFE